MLTRLVMSLSWLHIRCRSATAWRGRSQQACQWLQLRSRLLVQSPPYQVIAQRTADRWDNAMTYYVVVETLDLSAPAAPTGQATEADGPALPASEPFDSAAGGYKPAVKQVLRALATAHGGAEFSAHIWDEGVAAQTEVSYRATPSLFSDEQYAAKHLANSRHRIASYQGGIESPGQPAAYVLFWFPDASVDSPREGGLISSEMWRP